MNSDSSTSDKSSGTVFPEFGNCLHLSNHLNPMQRGSSSEFDDWLSRDSIKAVTASTAEDCDRHIDIVMRSAHLHHLAHKIFKILIHTDPLFKISFHLPKEVLGVTSKDPHIIHIKPYDYPHIHLTVLHEALHMVFELWNIRFGSMGKQTPFNESFRGISGIKDESITMLAKLYRILSRKYSSEEVNLTEEESNLLKVSQELAANDSLDYASTIDLWLPDDMKSIYKLDWWYSLRDLLRYSPLQKLDSFESINIPIRAKQIVQGPPGRSLFIFECRDPLVAVILRNLIHRNDALGYPEDQIDEEIVVRAVETTPLGLLDTLYPGMLDQLNALTDVMLFSYRNPFAVVHPRGRDSDYVYHHAAVLERLDVIKREKTPIMFRSEARLVLDVAKQAIANQDVEDFERISYGIANIQNNRGWQDPELEGDLNQAVNEMEKLSLETTKVDMAQLQASYGQKLCINVS